MSLSVVESDREDMRRKLEALRFREHTIKWTGPPNGQPCSSELVLESYSDSTRTLICRACGTIVEEVKTSTGEWERLP